MNGHGGEVLVNASNLHVGGGVQVAASFLSELARLKGESDTRRRFPWVDDLMIHASSPVVANIDAESLTAVGAEEHNVGPGLRGAIGSHPANRRFAVEFVIFGPRYGPKMGGRTIWGCADVTSFYPTDVVPDLPFKARAFLEARSRLARGLFRRQDALIVETDAMRQRVAQALGGTCPPLEVVANTCNAVFDHPDRWATPFSMSRREEADVLMAYVTRDYPHKNLAFLGPLHDEMETRGTRVKFLVTLSDDEWHRQTARTRSACINVGLLTIDRVPRLYEAADAVIFPSLLEAFSATPIEALKMRKPLFASDRDFVRSVVGESAFYFDPLDPAQAADIITRALKDEAQLEQAVASGAVLVDSLAGATSRAIRYLEVIDEQLCLAEGA